MADSAPVPPEQRKKLTVWLIAGAAASLLLPLLAAIYVRMNENVPVPGPSGRSDLFERREGGEVKLTPAQTPAVAVPKYQPARAASGGSSLDFIKTNDAMATQNPSPVQTESSPAPVQKPAAVAEPAAAAKPAPSKTATKTSKKEFSVPRLQPSKRFSSFKSGKTAQPQAAGEQDMSEMLKNLPPGSENNPQIQELLKNHR